MFRRFVNVKADSELLCALFRESSCTSIHLFRAPPQSNQTQTQYSSNWSEPTQPKNKSVSFCAGFSSASPDATLDSRRPFIKTKPLSCGFYRHSDRLLGRPLVDSHHFSENAQVQIVRVSRRPLPSTLHWTLLTPEYARFLAPENAARRPPRRPRRDSLGSTDAQTRARARIRPFLPPLRARVAAPPRRHSSVAPPTPRDDVAHGPLATRRARVARRRGLAAPCLHTLKSQPKAVTSRWAARPRCTRPPCPKRRAAGRAASLDGYFRASAGAAPRGRERSLTRV